MTALSTMDRIWRGFARYVEKPTLQLIGPQPVVRTIFALTAPLTSALPCGATVVRQTDGTLHITPQGTPRDAPIMYYLHGGGFTIGGPGTHAALVGHLAQAADMRAVVQRYRLAPRHPFPAAKDDAIAGFAALVSQGTPPAAICGDSAGGCLALQVACHARDNDLPMPAALGLIAPIADLSGDLEARFAAAGDEILIPPAWAKRILAAYLPGRDPADPEISPLRGDLTGLPPTLIQAATDEALAHDAHRLASAMDKVTLDLWPGMAHVWHLHAGRSPAADRALAQMGTFLAGHLTP